MTRSAVAVEGIHQVGMRGNAVGSCRRRHWPRWGPARESERTKVNRVPLRRGALGGIRISGGAARPNDDFLEGQPEGGARALSRPFTAPATATMPVARLRGPCGSGRSGLGRAFAFGGAARHRPRPRCGERGISSTWCRVELRESARARPLEFAPGAVTLGRGVVTSGRCVVTSVRKE